MHTTCRSSDVSYFILYKIYNVYNDGENHLSQFCPHRSLSYIYFEQSELVKGPIGDSILISSFLRYIDDFEKEAIGTIRKLICQTTFFCDQEIYFSKF